MSSGSQAERNDELDAVDHHDTKAGVKGLVDGGVVKVPNIFIRPPAQLITTTSPQLQVPVVDLSGMHVEDRRKTIVHEIREASEHWGVFQIINHGVPPSVLEGMLDGVRKFHEQDVEFKKEFYSTDPTALKVRYEGGFSQYRSKVPTWKDTLHLPALISGHIDPQELPQVCRNTSLEYIDHAVKLGEALFEILSEALGLKPDHLNAMECAKGQTLACHYYPPCPQPELTIGAVEHTDPVFLTILLQDQLGGLQVMHNNQWVDVEPIERGLVVNIGDILQMLSNDKFVSVTHRVVSKKIGPRISVGCFFTCTSRVPKMYGPIKELILEEKPPVYKEFTIPEYLTKFVSRVSTGSSALDLFRL